MKPADFSPARVSKAAWKVEQKGERFKSGQKAKGKMQKGMDAYRAATGVLQTCRADGAHQRHEHRYSFASESRRDVMFIVSNRLRKPFASCIGAACNRYDMSLLTELIFIWPSGSYKHLASTALRECPACSLQSSDRLLCPTFTPRSSKARQG